MGFSLRSTDKINPLLNWDDLDKYVLDERMDYLDQWDWEHL